MDVKTDNSKVNINLIKKHESLNKEIDILKKENKELKEQLALLRVSCCKKLKK